MLALNMILFYAEFGALVKTQVALSFAEETVVSDSVHLHLMYVHAYFILSYPDRVTLDAREYLLTQRVVCNDDIRIVRKRNIFLFLALEYL